MKPFSEQIIEMNDNYIYAEVDDIDGQFTTEEKMKGRIPAEKLFIGTSLKSNSVILIGMRKMTKDGKKQKKYEMCFQHPLGMMYTKETVPDKSDFYKNSVYPKKVINTLHKYGNDLKIEFKKRMKKVNIEID